jgi:hypothetical protein
MISAIIYLEGLSPACYIMSVVTYLEGPVPCYTRAAVIYLEGLFLCHIMPAVIYLEGLVPARSRALRAILLWRPDSSTARAIIRLPRYIMFVPCAVPILYCMYTYNRVKTSKSIFSKVYCTASQTNIFSGEDM